MKNRMIAAVTMLCLLLSIDPGAFAADAARYEVAIPFTSRYDFARDFVNERAIFYCNDKMGAIDTTGREVIAPKYDYISDFDYNRVFAVLNDEISVLDLQGNEIVPPGQYTFAYFVKENIICVETNGKIGYIDFDGNVILPLIYDHVYDGEFGGIYQTRGENWYYTPQKEFSLTEKDGLFGVIGEDYRLIAPAIYDYIEIYGEDGTACVCRNGKWGAIDRKGTEIIAPIYDNPVTFDENGFAIVAIDQKDGVIDRTGKELIPAINHQIQGIYDSVAVVNSSSGDYFADLTSGSPVKIASYDWIFYFHEGLASVRHNGKQGHVDQRGRLVTPLIYDSAGDFSEGMAIVSNNGKYGFVNNKGEKVTELVYDYAWKFSNGLAQVEQNGLYGFIDNTGREVIALSDYYDGFGDFNNDIALTEKDGLFGYINKKGEEILPPESPWVINTRLDGFGLFEEDGKWGLVNSSGIVLPPVYSSISQHTTSGLIMLTTEDEKRGLLNADGEIILDVECDYIGDLINDRIEYKVNGCYGHIDATGKVLIPPIYNNTIPEGQAKNEIDFTEGVAIVRRQDGYIGGIDLFGNEVVPFKYSHAKGRTDGLVALGLSLHEWGFVDTTTGEEVVPMIYEYVTFFSGGVSVVCLNNKFGMIDRTGAVVVPFEYTDLRHFSDGYAFAVKSIQEEGKSSPSYAVGFLSTQPSSWASKTVSRTINAGLLSMEDKCVYQLSLNREEFCEFAVRLYENITGEEIEQRSYFVDSSNIYVQKLAGLGVISGVGNDKFAPYATLTREQAAVITAKLSQALGKPLPEKSGSFADADLISSWAATSVGQVQAAGIMSGTGNNRFTPKAKLTREEGVIIMMNLLDSLQM